MLGEAIGVCAQRFKSTRGKLAERCVKWKKWLFVWGVTTAVLYQMIPSRVVTHDTRDDVEVFATIRPIRLVVAQ